LLGCYSGYTFIVFKEVRALNSKNAIPHQSIFAVERTLMELVWILRCPVTIILFVHIT
jgi:hypothetical protein